MPRTVKCALIQCSNAASTDLPIDEIKRLNIEKHLTFIEQAAEQGVQIICMQEIFTTPYFCAEQQTRWYEAVERIPDGPTVRLMQEVAKEHGMVIIVPIYEEELTGIYYNTAAVIDADGKYLGKYRKNHIPHVNPGFWEKFYFRPGNLGYPCFDTAFARIGVYICYDRHFPEGARALGLNGAEIVFNPSATSNRGTSASSTGRATSAIRVGNLSRKRRVTRTRSWWPIWISTRFAKCETRGNSSATAVQTRTAPWSQTESVVKEFCLWIYPSPSTA
jgi:predicted amidohydrolase